MSASTIGYGQEQGYDTEAGTFFALLKPRVMSLVIFTGIVGLVLAPGHIHPILALDCHSLYFRRLRRCRGH